MPDAALTVAVSAGTFSVLLEDVDSAVLGNPDLTLHVWISDAADGTFEYLGANPINSVPYAVVAGTAESVDGGAIAGEIDGSLIAAGTLNADKLGTITIDVPFIDADEDGTPGDTDVSMATILESISKNSALTFNDVNANRSNFEIFLELNQPVGTIEGWLGGTPTSGEFKDPFPIGQAYEYNGGLMPILSIIDENGNDITNTAGDPIPGLTFVWVTNQDVEGTSPGSGINDGLTEGRMVVRGTPSALGDYTVRVKAKNRWGQAFVQEYTVHVRNVDVDSTVFVQRIPEGGSSYTTSGANDPYGANPVRFQFTVEDLDNNPTTLDDDIVVRWTVPVPTGGTTTTDIMGDAGRFFYVNSPDGPVAGTTSSQGVIELDEDPFAGDISHVGTYTATILFDWGQGVLVGSDTIDSVQEGFAFTNSAIVYNAPSVGTNDLFDQFTHSAATYPIGDENIANQLFGLSPSGDEPGWSLTGVIEAGETSKNLIGENPFAVQVGEGIAGTMENRWIQQKVARLWNGSTYVNTIVGTRVLDNRTVSTDGTLDPVVDLDVDGFGPIPEDTNWPLAIGGGVIGDDENKRAAFSYPEDGGPLTFNSTPGARARPIAPTNAWTFLSQPNDIFVTYWLYSTNSFIDSMAPITAIIEVGDNINIVNDLLPINQVAGYPGQIGGDFGTTNGLFFQGLFPDPVSTASSITAWGINDIAYIWNSVDNPWGNGFSLVNPSNANSILVPGSSMINWVTPSDSSVDFRYSLELDSGFSAEMANNGNGVNVTVLSDVVIYDFHMQHVDLTQVPGTAPYYVDFGAEDITQEALTVVQGEDVLLTVQAYIRPSLLTGLDEGGITTLARDLNARFFIVPTATNTPVEITNNITKIVDTTTGLDADTGVPNHVQPIAENRALFTWEVILENPLEVLADTNIATGYVYAVITSTKGGVTLNQVSTLAGAANAIAEYDAGFGIGDDTNGAIAGPPEENLVDGVLDARVKMPLTSSEAVLTVTPLP
jgi:hypothetical protein